MNRRRALVALLAAGALSAPLRLRAQAAKRSKPYRIGLLPDFGERVRTGFVRALEALGWVEKRDFTIVLSRFPGGPHVEAAAAQMVGQKPDLIVIGITAYATAAHRLTKTIPIVLWASGYPVEAGIAESLARPGKNVTGNTVYAGTGVWGKFVDLLRGAKPGIRRIGVLWSYVPPGHTRKEIAPAQEEIRQAARLLGMEAHIIEVGGATAKLPDALIAMGNANPDALILTSGQGLPNEDRISVMQFAAARKLPTIADALWSPTVELQPLIVYAPSFAALMRNAAAYVVRILGEGAQPGELPIQQPAKFELVLNLKTAKAIGIEFSQELLFRADRVMD